VVVLGGLLTLVSLFLKWFDPGGSAWTVFEVIDLLLAGLSIGALALAAGRLGFTRTPAVNVPLWAPGAVALVLVVSQLINHPPAAQNSHIQAGAWIALAGAALMLLGARLASARVMITIRPPTALVTPAPAPPRPKDAAPAADEPGSTASMPDRPEPPARPRPDAPS
jgi:hypothetical protein